MSKQEIISCDVCKTAEEVNDATRDGRWCHVFIELTPKLSGRKGRSYDLCPECASRVNDALTER